jgi:hypothetical protein
VSLVERIKAILVNPKSEWPKIAGETTSVQALYTGYIMILAVIGPLAMLVAFAPLGVPFALRTALVNYIGSLVVVAVLALIADLLAPSFGGKRDYVASLKLIAYSFTAVWCAQIALIVPLLGGLVVLIGTIYAFYLFMLGAPVLGKCASARAVPFTIFVLLCSIVLFLLIRALVMAPVLGGAPLGAGGVFPIRY